MVQDPDTGAAKGPKWPVEVARNLRLSWRLWRDPRVPLWTKLIPLAAAGYVLLPTDFIPDVIVGLGQVDDLTALLMGIKFFMDLCPADVVKRHREEMSAIRASYRVMPEGGALPLSNHASEREASSPSRTPEDEPIKDDHGPQSR